MTEFERAIQIRNKQFNDIFGSLESQYREKSGVKTYFNSVYFFLTLTGMAELRARLNENSLSASTISIFLAESLISLSAGSVYSSLFSLRAAEDSLLNFLADFHNISLVDWEFKKRKIQLSNVLTYSNSFDDIQANYSSISRKFHSHSTNTTVPIYLSEVKKSGFSAENIKLLNEGIEQINLLIVETFKPWLKNWSIQPLENQFRLSFSNTKSDKLIDFIKDKNAILK